MRNSRYLRLTSLGQAQIRACLASPRSFAVLTYVLDVAWAYGLKQSHASAPKAGPGKKHKTTATPKASQTSRPTVSLLAKGFFCDISQDHSRQPWTNQVGVKCITSSSDIYSFALGRTLAPIEHSRLQGRRFPMSGTLRQSEYRAIYGEGMHAACLSAVIYAAYLAMDL